ncbi:MAG: Wadjet anti-phage system protein JetD domain-containing protein [Pseudomonadota bacterium]
MDTKARNALVKLLDAGNRAKAGVRSTPPALTRSQLSDYRATRSLLEKEAFEAVMKSARAIGAVTLIWPKGQVEEDFIERVELVDLDALADLLGVDTAESKLERAKSRFAPLVQDFPVLNDVLARWASLKKIRTFGPEDYQDWVDAAHVITFMIRNLESRTVDVPIREVSARLFKDSKRIEKLAAPVDVLLTGDVDAEIREPADVWQEIGLFREEQPVRMAGKIVVARTRVTECLDAPYSAFSASSVTGLAGIPKMVMTIENQTTFHSEAKRRHDEEVLLIYTAGMPTPAWRAMYVRLLGGLPPGVPVYHWGDIDEGGFRIASILAQDARSAGHTLQPWMMHPDDVPEDRRVKARPHTLERIRRFASAAGWGTLGEEIATAGFTVEQEGLPIVGLGQPQ